MHSDSLEFLRHPHTPFTLPQAALTARMGGADDAASRLDALQSQQAATAAATAAALQTLQQQQAALAAQQDSLKEQAQRAASSAPAAAGGLSAKEAAALQVRILPKCRHLCVAASLLPQPVPYATSHQSAHAKTHDELLTQRLYL